jgi:site-specific DNA-methyltransferase (adenine-specific)
MGRTRVNGRARRPTVTARFGSGRRENHDASGFYDRFVAPEISSDATVVRPSEVDVIYSADARDMAGVESNSVALVVTSPPYFAGKEYEESLGEGGVPATYFEYLDLLRDVFAECKRVLEPGGRIAVNVANLGRRPYRSLAGDVTGILQDLGLLLRGEVVWWKGKAAGGSCAWGSFQHPSNPVLRDVTERIVIAGKGRFDRALPPDTRAVAGHPSAATITRDEFLEATTDLWEIPPESATKVGHPAPFPVALPARLIELYTYRDDVVLDPFMGSGSTAVAAVRAGRRFIGFDTDESYVERARARVEAERDRARPARLIVTEGGRRAKEVAGLLLEGAGFVDVRPDVTVPGVGLDLGFLATDRGGGEWAFEVHGGFTSGLSGLRRGETLWRALGRAAVVHAWRPELPLVLLTTEAPAPRSSGDAALSAVRGEGRPVFDVIAVLDPNDRERLEHYANRGSTEDAAAHRRRLVPRQPDSRK